MKLMKDMKLPLGRDKMQSLGMLPLQYGFSEDYDESINPSVLNEFATAAFRFGHSLIQGKVELVFNLLQSLINWNLLKYFKL